MNATYEGRTIAQWMGLLRSGDVVAKCAAALALLELKADEPSVRAALVRALKDPDPPVQAAAQVAVGLVNVGAENRQKMLRGLLAANPDARRDVLQSLHWLMSPEAMLESVP